MYKKIRQKARKELDRILTKIDLELSESTETDYKSLLNQLDAISRLSNLYSPLEKLYRAGIPIFLAMVIILPFWLIHQPTPQIILNATVSSLDLSVSPSEETLTINEIGDIQYLRINGLDDMESDVGDIGFLSGEGTGSSYVDGELNISRIVLDTLDLINKKDESIRRRVAISKRQRLVRLDVQNMKMAVHAFVESDTRVVSTLGRNIRQDTLSNANLEFHSGSDNNSMSKLYFTVGEDRKIDLPIMHPTAITLRDISFSEEGERETFSSIVNGKLSFIGTGENHELLRGTPLVLGELSGNLRISIEQGDLTVLYHGAAGVLGFGENTEHITQDLRPTLAEWISSDKVIALAWSGLLFVIGLILTVRQTMNRSNI